MSPFLNGKRVLGTTALCLGFLLVGCGGGGSSSSSTGGTVTPTPVTLTVVNVTSSITAPTTWTEGNLYLVGNISLSSTLTIQPGVYVKFVAGGALDVSTGGSISALGTAAKPIVFTSYKDNTKGGATNLNVLNPAVGDWRTLTLNASGSAFNYCEFYYGGGDSAYRSTLRFGNAYSASITNCTFAHNDGGDLLDSWSPRGALDADFATAGTVITGNTFYDNNVPLKVSGLFSVDNSNTFHNPANTSVTNKYNGIFLIGHSSKPITGLLTFSETEVPFVFAGDVSIPASSALTLGDDVVVKFFSATDTLRVSGTLKADATTGHKIVFTSMKDDAHGGDTNGDGSITSPAVKDWADITLNASASSFTRCEFYFGGHDSAHLSTLRFGGAYSATINGCTFAHNDGGNLSDIVWNAFGALDAQQATAGTVVSGNVFYGNAVPLKISGKFSLDDSNIFHNPASPSTTNTYNGICFSGNSYNDFVGQIALTETEVPFVLQGDLWVTATNTLTLGSGVVFKFTGTGTQFTISGTLVVPAGNVVKFTSLKDDSALGDTNGDSGASSSSSTDWAGVRNAAWAWYHPANVVISYAAH
jgi:hypothetical protein